MVSDDELIRFFADRFRPRNQDIEQKLQREIFEHLSEIDNIDMYYDDMLYKDLNRYFAAEKEEQDKVKGAYLRTSYMKSNIIKARKGWKDTSDNSGLASYFG